MSRIAVLTNPTAGRGRGAEAREVVVRRLTAAGHDVADLVGTDAADAEARARAAVAGGVAGLVAVGGDGLINVAVQAVGHTDVPLGVVAAGTGNDTARALGLPRHDVLAASDRVVASLATGRRRRIDLARTAGRYFTTVLCAGFDAQVNERADTMPGPGGRWRYTAATLAQLRTLRPLDYALELDGRSRRFQATMVSVGNTASFGGGLRISEGARIDDGMLDVAIIGPMDRIELMRTFPRLFTGTHTRHPAFQRHRVRTVTVAAPGVVAYADGERLGALPLTVTCEPGALEVLV